MSKKKKTRFIHEELNVKFSDIFMMVLKKELDQETGKKIYRIIDIHIIV